MITEIQPTLFRDVEKTPSIPADITANRHKGNKASVAANPTQGKKAEMHKKLFAYINYMGRSWLHDLCREFGKPPNEISPRLTEMKAAGMIYETGERVERCAELKVCK